MSKKPRLPWGLAECAGCGKVFAREALGPVESGPHLLRWDKRPKGPAGWRIGRPDEGKALAPESWERRCAACGGVPGSRLEADRTPLRSGKESVTHRVVPSLAPAVPLWRQAREAWAKTEASQPWHTLRGKRGG